MATDSYSNPYIDSSVFIAWIHKEVIDGVNRFAIADHVIKKAERGDYPIYISALTIAEVHKLPRGTTPALTAAEDDLIIRFFRNDVFKVLPIDRDIGETANRFCRDYGIHGNDAIHLASALRAKCDALLVWDRPLATKVQRPDIRIEAPQIFGQMILTSPPVVPKSEEKAGAVSADDAPGAAQVGKSKPSPTEANIVKAPEPAPPATAAQEIADDKKARND